METIRDINRITNALNAKCHVIGNEVNFVDLFMITFIENKYPDLYDWIKSHKNALVDYVNYDLYWRIRDKEELKKYHMELLSRLNINKSNLYYNLLSDLFPYFGKISDGIGVDYDECYRKRRIGDKAFFDRYFCLEMDNDDIEKNSLDSALYDMDEKELSAFVDDSNNKHTITSFIEEIKVGASLFSKDRLSVLAKVLIRKAATLQGDRDNAFVPISNAEFAKYEVRHLLEQIKDNDCIFGIISDELRESDEYGIQTLAYIINDIRLAYGRLPDDNSVSADKQIISEKQLDECEKLYLTKIKELQETTDLFEYSNAHIVLFVYQCLDEEDYNRYIDEKTSNDIGIIRFVCTFSGYKYGSDGKTVGFSNKYRDRFNDDQIINAFNKIIDNKDIWKLNEREIRRIVAFEICVKKGMEDFASAKEEEIDKRIEELMDERSI